MIDALFVNPPSPNNSIIIRDFNRSGRTSKERVIWPQTSLAYLAAMMPSNFKVEIIDCIAENIKWPKFLSLLKEKNPRYLISHLITSTAHNDLRAFKEAKKINPNTITVTMGPHATALAKETLEENPELNFILLNEPEMTIKELVTAIEEKRSDLTNIKGLAYSKNGKIQINEKREFIPDLDILPIPRHDLLPLNKYVFPFIPHSFTFVLVSRGCPYFCTFCRQPIMWARKLRSRSPESVIKELKFLQKIGLREILFHSDTFTADKDFVIGLCKKMIDERLKIKWSCNSRVDTVDEEMLRWMKKAGCRLVAYGIESGSQKILDKCKKGITLDQVKKVINLTHEIGIKMEGYFIIGLPGETRETIRETIDLAKSLPLTFALFHTASPYPGTDFYQEVKEKGWLISEKWEDVNQGTDTPINYPQLSAEEINRGIKMAYRQFYLRPKSVWNILLSLRNLRDIKGLARSVINQIF